MTSTLTVNGVGAGPNRLYLATVAIYGDTSGTSVSSVSGGGLTWSLQKSQCSSRLNRARMEVWQAFGSPSANFDLDITLTGIAVVSAAVSRYSGADTTTPTEGAAGSNTYGMNGICDGNGIDNDALSLSLTSSQNDSVLYAASHPRNKGLDIQDADYTSRAAISNSDGGDGANLFIHDRTLATAGTDSADHTASGTTSWEMAGLVINPASVSATPAVTSAVGEISPNDVSMSSTANAFSYDIQATISGSATGVDRVAITVPGSFGAPTVTDVQVDGVSATYTDNTVGNDISVDLSTKVTASSRITVLFNADAPTTQDLMGIGFFATVDDSGTGDAAQYVDEGNGDGDAGDNNSWTVTTTDNRPAITSAVAEISPNDVSMSVSGYSFSYDIQATISGGDTGVDRVAITVPGSFGAPTVTDVQVDGLGVAYTNNTVGNAISVDLTSTVTTSSKITVLFNADAPNSPDATGVNFTSTLDWVASGAAAQAATEGNGDGDAGDNNSWKVTTTDNANDVTSAVAEISPASIVTSSGLHAFEYDIDAIVGAAEAGINRVAISVPGTFGAPTVENVKVNGVGVAFTDNTVGNNISVDLTTKLASSGRITVTFTSQSPGTEDLTGVNFTSTVDHSATADPVMSTTEGNGDGDAGDANTWTVTTANPTGGTCPAVESFASTGTSAAGSSITISHTTSGTDRLMLVGVSINNDNLETVTSVTYNGVGLSFVGAVDRNDDARVEIWQLTEANGLPTGTHNVVVTFSAALLRSAVAGVLTFTGVDQTTPLGTFAGNSNTSSGPATVNVSSAAGEIVFAVVSGESVNWIAANEPATQRWNLSEPNPGPAEFAAGATDAGAASVTMNFGLGRSDHWAVGGVSIKGSGNCNPAVTSAVAEISPNDVTTSSTGNSFSYDIQATIGGGDTGVDRVAITVPGTFGAPTVTDVQDDGVSVAYTDNTVGNDISVDLTTKITASSKITVLFDADAPTTQDLTGVDFTSTVDDSATGDAAQSTTEGNGDGDAGDNNSWTVTTTDAAGTPAVTSAVAEISPNDVTTSSTGNAFSYDIQATIGGGDTGINRVAITVPGSFGAPTVTDVQVDGVSAAYTDGTVGNAISVDLTTKITASSKITVLFNADAPTIQDLTGVNFTSTVDDTGTGDAAQATTEGNGDGDAGDANTWTVTTTDAAGGGCPIDVSVIASSDDAEENVGGGTVDLTSSDLELINDGTDQEVGLRFQNLGIAPGSTITNAYVTFYAKSTTTTGTPNYTIYAEDADSAVTFSNTAPDKVTTRTKTTASVTWPTVSAWSVADAAHNTPDISSVIQEVVDRAGWASGNDLVIIVNGDAGALRRAWSFDGAGTAAALHVECSAAATPAVTSAVAEISPNDVVTSSTGNSFSYDIQATISGAATGVNEVTITVPGTFGAPTITDVQDDGVSVAYTNNTVGNAISLALTTKITASSKITVLFNSDAPTTQDLTGVDFTSTVDDTGTGDAAQATTEGNGDGDAGDANSWTVTTTDSAGSGGGACPAPGAGGWYPGGWLYRKPLSIGSGNVSSNLTDFPVLVSLASDTDLAADAQGDFDDILFTAADGTTKLSHEIEKYNETTGELVAWVKVPTVSSSADTVFYMYYGNATAGNQQDPTGVWSNGYAGVWHLKEDPSGTAPQMNDSTSNALHATSVGSMTSGNQIGGQIDGALDFDGSDDYLTSSDYDITGAITVSAWVNWDAISANNEGIVSKRTGDENNGNWALRFNSGVYEWLLWSGIDSRQNLNSLSAPTAGQWEYVVLTFDDPTNTARIYLDGGLDNSNTSMTNNLADTPEIIKIAQHGQGSTTLNGKLDEVRLASAARSADWISAEYINQADHDNFQSLCAEETDSSTPAVTSAVAEISPNDVTTSSTGNSFSYDIQATIGGGDTGVNRVAITVPGTFGAPTVTDVQDDGVSVAYTDNTAGNNISVDITTKITATSKITVLFDSDAPTSADATGVDFTSTVDDTGTGDAAQATTEGNGDGDAGDLNSWTVTTTDSTGLLARYWLDEAASGQVPANLNDSEASPLNLSLSYVATSPEWQDGTGGNRHLRFYGTGSTTDTGGAQANSGATKMDGLHGSQTATLVAKYAMDSNVCTNNGDRIVGISDGDASADGWLAMRERGSRDGLQVRWAGVSTVGFYALGNGTPSCPVDSASTVHWVVDTTQAVAADRVKAYIDGVAQTVQVMNGALPPQNATIDLGPNTRRLFIGQPHTGYRTFRGRIWYAAIYDTALSSATVSSDATAINACDDAACEPAVTSAVAEITPNDVVTSSTGNSFTYDIQATISGSETGVNRVTITVPGSFGAPTVTGVQVGGVGVAYTDNTSGNDISVDLTTKVTASNKITVLFNADAPTSQDLVGVDFLSTVDDSGTAVAAQSTTEGNGDGDGGDNNSWTVTTTNGGSGNLIGHWAFNDGSGQTATDSSASSNNGTLGTSAGADSADPNWVCSGTALDFDGSNDEVQLSSVPVGNRTAYTINAWIKMSPDSGDKRTIYGEGNTAQTEYFYLQVEQGGNSVTYYSENFGASNYAQMTGTSNVEDDTWHMVTLVQRSKTDHELYVDGISEDTSAQNSGTVSFNTASIGYLRTDWVADPFLGTIDDVRIYDYALTVGEIASLYASPPSCGANLAVTSAVAEISPNDVITSSTGNAFSYDIQAAINRYHGTRNVWRADRYRRAGRWRFGRLHRQHRGQQHQRRPDDEDHGHQQDHRVVHLQRADDAGSHRRQLHLDRRRFRNGRCGAVDDRRQR
jgi:hypothetical protein